MNDDPRLGLPSASRLEILALCPGSEQLRRTLPVGALDSSDEYTEMGNRIHKARETGSTVELSETEQDIYNRGLTTEKTIIEDWQRDFGIEAFIECQPEQRLFLTDPNTLKPATSGQLDAHYLSGTFVLVEDWKSLWCSNLTSSERNWQGKLQAVLAAREYDAQHVRVAFNKAMFGSSDVCDYDGLALRYAEFSIFHALWEAEQTGAQLRPGKHCTHCPCKAYCREAVNYAQLPAATAVNGSPLDLIPTLPPETLVEVWRRKSVVNKIFDGITKRLSDMPDEELNRLGLKQKAGKKLDYIRDVAGAFDALKTSGMDESQIFQAVSFGKGELIKAIMDFKNCRKAEAEAFWNTQLDDFIERKQGNPSLEEI